MRCELFLIQALPGLQTPNKSSKAFYSFTGVNVLYSHLYSQRNTFIISTCYHYAIFEGTSILSTHHRLNSKPFVHILQVGI